MKKIFISMSLITMTASVSAGWLSGWEHEGYYVGANIGVNFSELKMEAEGIRYTSGGTYGGEASGWRIIAGATDMANQTLPPQYALILSHIYDDLMRKEKRRSKVIAEVNISSENKKDNMTAGIEINAGLQTGSSTIDATTITSGPNGAATVYGINGALTLVEIFGTPSVKQRWHLSIMPNVGYKIKNDLGVYLTAGVKIAKWCVKAQDMLMGNLNLGTDAITMDKSWVNMQSKSSIKMTPVIGIGAKYDLTKTLFAKIEYNYECQTNLGKSPKMAPEFKKFKISGNVFKIGIGSRF